MSKKLDMIWVIQGKIPKNTIGRVLMEGGRRNDPTNNICPEIMLFHYLIMLSSSSISFFWKKLERNKGIHMIPSRFLREGYRLIPIDTDWYPIIPCNTFSVKNNLTTLVVIVETVDSGGSSAEDLYAPLFVIIAIAFNGSELRRQPSSGPLACCLCAAKHPNVSNLLHHHTIIIVIPFRAAAIKSPDLHPNPLSIICCHPLSSHYCRRHSTSHAHPITPIHTRPPP